MWNRIKISLNDIPKIVGIILLAVGIILLVITGIITYSIELTNETISSISVLISISLGLISIGIAIYSIGLSRDSDEKMQSIANYHLLEIKDIIEDRRLSIQKHIKKLNLMATTSRDYTVDYDDISYGLFI